MKKTLRVCMTRGCCGFFYKSGSGGGFCYECRKRKSKEKR